MNHVLALGCVQSLLELHGFSLNAIFFFLLLNLEKTLACSVAKQFPTKFYKPPCACCIWIHRPKYSLEWQDVGGRTRTRVCKTPSGRVSQSSDWPTKVQPSAPCWLAVAPGPLLLSCMPAELCFCFLLVYSLPVSLSVSLCLSFAHLLTFP